MQTFVSLIDSLRPINNLSVIKGRVFLGLTITKLGLMWLAQGHNAVTPVRLEPPAPWSQVKHSITANICQCFISACGFLSLADIVLVLGASSSEGALGYQKQIDAVARLVNDFQIGPDNVQIALVTFSDTAHAQFYLNLWHLKIQVLAGIQRARYSPGKMDQNYHLR